MIHNLYYWHFFCHVFHQDYVIRKGHSIIDFEHRISGFWISSAQYLDEYNARTPATAAAATDSEMAPEALEKVRLRLEMARAGGGTSQPRVEPAKAEPRGPSAGDFLQSLIGRARPEEADRRHHHAHSRGNEDEYAEGARTLEHEGDDEG
jgi:hypothetical protein